MNNPIITKDFSNNKIKIEKYFDAPKTKVWNAWTNDKILAKWWGPKQWPATSKSFEFKEWWHWHYYMTGPDWTQAWWWIDYLSIKPEEYFSAKDAFCDSEGNKSTSMPSTLWEAKFSEHEDKTLLVIELTFEKNEDMKKLIEMWFEEWFTDALDNLDQYLSK